MARAVSPRAATLGTSTWERLTETDWASMGEGKLLFYRAVQAKPHALFSRELRARQKDLSPSRRCYSACLYLGWLRPKKKCRLGFVLKIHVVCDEHNDG